LKSFFLKQTHRRGSGEENSKRRSSSYRIFDVQEAFITLVERDERHDFNIAHKAIVSFGS